MKLVVAYSGGLDSHCLLHMLSQSQFPEYSGKNLLAIHINHHLSEEADNWQTHCQKTCDKLDVQLIVEDVYLDLNSSQSIEQQARVLRYKYLSNHLNKKDILLTAHHLDDQAETFLLQAMRGAGVKGLASMPERKSFADGEHHRPLLNWSRQQLMDYATKHQLTWIEDDSNADTSFDRNFIRHKVMPKLTKRWQKAANSLAQSARYCAQSIACLNELAEIDAREVIDSQRRASIAKLTTLSPARQINVLHYWLKTCGCTIPEESVLHQLFTAVIAAREDAMPKLQWQGGEIRRYRQYLYASPAFISQPIKPFQWQVNEPLFIHGKVVEFMPHIKHLPETVQIRNAKPNDSVRYHGQSKSLKKVFQGWGIPPWERETLPLAFNDNQLLGYMQLHSIPAQADL